MSHTGQERGGFLWTGQASPALPHLGLRAQPETRPAGQRAQGPGSRGAGEGSLWTGAPRQGPFCAQTPERFCKEERAWARPGEADGRGANLPLPFHHLLPRSEFTLGQIKSPSACWREPSGSPQDTPTPPPHPAPQWIQTLQWAGGPIQKQGEGPGPLGSCQQPSCPRRERAHVARQGAGQLQGAEPRGPRVGRTSGAGDEAGSSAGHRGRRLHRGNLGER